VQKYKKNILCPTNNTNTHNCVIGLVLPLAKQWFKACRNNDMSVKWEKPNTGWQYVSKYA